MEGNDAEAARLAVSEGLSVKLIVDDNDVTIAGHPSKYFTGYSVERTLAGHGLKTVRRSCAQSMSPPPLATTGHQHIRHH
jgi:transketolase